MSPATALRALRARPTVSAAGLFVALGVLDRAVRYGLRFPLWEDECFLDANLIGRSFGELLAPLQFHQVAPPLFLFAQKGVVDLLGFSEWTLRLLPFAASLASLVLFRRLAGLLLDGAAEVLAVALFAVSYPCVRYGAESKPYGVDLLVTLVLLVPVAAWWRGRATHRVLWVLPAIVPLALGLSFPAAFVASGLAAFLFVALARRPEARIERRIVALHVVVTGLSLLAWQAVLGPQRAAEEAFMQGHWRDAFPPESLARLPLWLLSTHAGDLLAYPFGGGRWGSAATFLLALTGLGMILRRRRLELGVLLTAPFALHLGAAFLRRYPYGGHAKLSLYLSPLICVVTAIGLRAVLGAARRRGRRCVRPALVALAAVAVVTIGRDLAFPYKTASDERARSFARWFWPTTALGEEVVCAYADLGLDLAPGTFRELSWSATYLCNRRIFAPRERPDLARVSATRPLRCLVYRDPRFALDGAAFARWLQTMGERYEAIGHESFSFPRYDKRERRLLQVDTLESYLFRPRPAGNAGGAPGAQ